MQLLERTLDGSNIPLKTSQLPLPFNMKLHYHTLMYEIMFEITLVPDKSHKKHICPEFSK